VKPGYIYVSRHEEDADRMSKRYQERLCACVSKIEKGNQLILAVFSCSSNENGIHTERGNCFVSSIRLLVRFDSRTFALALSARISIAQFSAELRVVLVYTA